MGIMIHLDETKCKIYRIRIEVQQKILRVAEIEGALWADAQLWVKDTLPTVQPVLNC